MRYLIHTKDGKVFTTPYFDATNIIWDVILYVYDLTEMKYTPNGINWLDIKEDHL